MKTRTNYNQWQNIMGILKSLFKNPPSPHTMLRTHNIAWRKFCSLFLKIVKRAKGIETRNCSNSSFSHNSCHWLSEKTWKILNVVIYSQSFWITLKARNYPLRHYDISLCNFWSPNRQLNYLGKWDKIFIFQNFFKQNQIMSITKKILLDSPLYMRLLHQENKFQIGVIRRRYPETKNCLNRSFSNNLCHWNLNNKKHFSSAFKPKIGIPKRC